MKRKEMNDKRIIIMESTYLEFVELQSSNSTYTPFLLKEHKLNVQNTEK